MSAELGAPRWTPRRCAALALLAVGAGFAGFGLARAVHHRVPLRALLGPDSIAWPALLGASLALHAAAAAAVARSARRGAPDGGLPSLLRALFVVLTLAAAAFLALLQPFQKLYFDLAAGLAWGGFAALVLVLELAPSGRWPRARRALDFALFTLCAAALGGEGALRAWALVRPSSLFAQPEMDGLRSRGLKRAPGEIGMGFAYNSGGHYDEEFTPVRSERARIAVIGDSFSLGVVPHEWHYTTVAERALPGSEFLNLGVAAVGPPEYLHMLQDEALPLRPDLIVIALFAGNDIGCSGYAPDRPWRWLRVAFDRQNLLLYGVPVRLAQLRRVRAMYGKEGGEAFLAAVAAQRVLTREEILRAMPWVEDPLREPATFPEAAFLKIERTRVLTSCGDDDKPYGLLRGQLERIVRAAGEVPLAVMLIPDEFQVEDDLWERVGASIPAAKSRGLDRDRPQKEIAGFMRERGVPLLDLLPALRAVEPLADGRRHVYQRRDTHFNARGNAVAGRELARFAQALLAERGLN